MSNFNTVTLLEGTNWLGTLGSILPFLLLIPIFYFLMYRPQKKQEKETAAMRNNLMIGDEIVTIGGIIGKVVKVKDDYIVIETGSDKSRLKLRKSAVSSVEKKADDNDNQRSTFKVKSSSSKKQDSSASYDPEKQ